MCKGRPNVPLPINFENNTTSSETVLENEGWLWGGWILCSVLSVSATFFCAHWLRELVPGAKQVL